MSERPAALVIEDEPVVRDAIRHVLEPEGWTVLGVADAESALAHPALATCALVICDVMLPGRSGLDAVRAIRQRRPELPVLMVSGYAAAGIAAEAAEAGAAFLAKPFDDVELLTLVRRVLPDVAGKEGRP